MAAFDAERHQRWRSQVVLGPLPDDFLRVRAPAPQPTGPAPSVVAAPPQQVVALPPQIPGYTSGYPTNNQGVLEVTVNQARLTKNYGLTRMDPFCRIRVGHTVLETPTASNAGKNPRWNKLLRSNVPVGVNSLYLEIFDERTFQVEERVAWCHLELPERLMTSSAVVDEWYPLNGKQGEGKEGVVNVIMSFTPAPPQLVQPQIVGAGGYPVMVMPNQPPVQMVQPLPSQPAAVPAQPAVVSNVNNVRAVNEADVQNLVDMFPAMPRDTVRSILENCGGNMERAVDTLVSMSS